MAPAFIFLSRDAVQSGQSNYAYNPHTLFLTHKSQFSNYSSDQEISTNLLAEDHGAINHEHVHWLQHHGTTVGAFLSLLRYSQQRTVLDGFRSLPLDLQHRCLHDRINGIPIVRIDESNSNLVIDPGDDNDLNVFRQIWYDHQLVHLAIENSKIQDNLAWPRGLVMGEVIGDTILYACERASIADYPGNEVARVWYKFDEEDIIFHEFEHERITTRFLMEAAATANELLSLAPFGAFGDAIFASVGAVIDKLLSTGYGTPFKMFLARLNFEITSAEEFLKVLPAFNALCYAALSPPLPPIFMGPPLRAGGWRWVDIYPPARFALLLNSVNRHPLLQPRAESRLLINYIDNLCDDSTLVPPSSYSQLRYQPANDFDHNQKFQGARMLDYHDYLLWVQSKILSLRSEILPLIANFGESLQGPSVSKYAKYIMIGKGSDGDKWFMPPLYCLHTDKVGFGSDREFGRWLAINNGVHYSLFDLVVGKKKITFVDYPKDVRNAASFKSRIAHELSAAFKIDLRTLL